MHGRACVCVCVCMCSELYSDYRERSSPLRDLEQGVAICGVRGETIEGTCVVNNDYICMLFSLFYYCFVYVLNYISNSIVHTYMVNVCS